MIYLLHHTIDRRAAAHPERPAFRCGHEALSYGHLVRRANRLAHLLIEQGVERGDRVGIYLNRSLACAVAVYGILKAGAAYVPLDPEAPVGRTRRLIEDCELRHLITTPLLRRNFSGLLAQPSPLTVLIGVSHAPTTVTTYDWTVLANYPTTPPALRILEDDLAYIMYTSGSTGAPKGIMHTHRSGLAYARLSAALYGVGPDDVVANHCALHYDISTFGYFTAPTAGATTVIVSDAHTRFPTSLLQLIEEAGITIWYSVPLALLQLLRSPTLAERDLTALRWILFGGEVFAPRHLRGLMQYAPRARASNVYGPAEVNQCTYFHLDAPPHDDAPIPLGRIWDNTEGLIVDAHDREVSTGQAGELLIRSATRMLGYWKRPDLTARSLYHRELPCGRRTTFYRTGDLVYTDSAGNLVFVGRKDRQVKIRGHRVELEEVEAALTSLLGVGEAAVYTRPVGREEAVHTTLTIAALVVPEALHVPDPTNWLSELASRLPAHAVPTDLQLVDRLPRNDAGKIDRLAINDLVHNSIA